MADTKITALAAIATVDPAADVLPIVDISDTSMAASGTTKKVTSNQILGAGGTATLASATITGALTVDTSTLVANAAGYTDKVGVGTATPAATLHVKGSGRVDGDYNLFDFYKDNGSTRLGYLLFRDDGANYLNVNSNQPLYLSTNNTVKVQVETSGDVKINTGNVVMGTSGKGIDFSAVTGGTGTATANVLNDYEEGTFTPIVQGSTAAGVGVYSVQIGRYTKIGRLVTVEIYIGWTAHTGTGNLRIGGLPFTVNAAAYSAATIGLISSITLSASNTASAFNEINTTYINIVQSPVGGGTFTDVPMDVAGTFVISSTYSV